MEVTTQKYIRKPLYVDAVRVTSSNFDDIVAWCQGEVQVDEIPGSGVTKKFIKVRVHNPKNPRQTKAFIGDWLLYTERGYKVYTNKAFRGAFDLVEGPVGEQSLYSTLSEPAPASGTPGIPPTPPDEEIELVEATPGSIAQAVEENEQARADEEAAEHGAATGADPEFEGVTPQSEQKPEDAAEGKRVLSEEEQRQMGPDEVRELVHSGDVVLAQDLEEAV